MKSAARVESPHTEAPGLASSWCIVGAPVFQRHNCIVLGGVEHTDSVVVIGVVRTNNAPGPEVRARVLPSQVPSRRPPLALALRPRWREQGLLIFRRAWAAAGGRLRALSLVCCFFMLSSLSYYLVMFKKKDGSSATTMTIISSKQLDEASVSSSSTSLDEETHLSSEEDTGSGSGPGRAKFRIGGG